MIYFFSSSIHPLMPNNYNFANHLKSIKKFFQNSIQSSLAYNADPEKKINNNWTIVSIYYYRNIRQKYQEKLIEENKTYLDNGYQLKEKLEKKV